MKNIAIFCIIILTLINGCSSNAVKAQSDKTVVGAEQYNLYMDKLHDKNVAVVANHTSMVNEKHLVDFLVENGISVSRIFCPEHGFRGKAGAGIVINDDIDPVTNIPIISLYGNHKKPTDSDLKDVDIVVFDLQDVGVRFYTYISTMSYVMEACADNNIPIIVLDRPNPNAHLIDGPVLNPDYQSFVGLHPVPIVYGMTIGEYAMMANGEKWLNTKDGNLCNLTVIPIANYTHKTYYELPVAPSPNLQTMNAINHYPYLCLFEGTAMSVGRGTSLPFELVGHPKLSVRDTSFTPVPIPNVAENPKLSNQLCYGISLENDTTLISELDLQLIIDIYNNSNLGNDFFISYFEKLAGNGELRQQIMSGLTPDEIRESWQPQLDEYKKIRSKYLLYKD